jgi:hypothetical protein
MYTDAETKLESALNPPHAGLLSIMRGSRPWRGLPAPEQEGPAMLVA